MWKRFYDTIEIRERHNPKLRRTNMPQRYWETMTEFQDESYFTAQAGTEELPPRTEKRSDTRRRGRQSKSLADRQQIADRSQNAMVMDAMEKYAFYFS